MKRKKLLRALKQKRERFSKLSLQKNKKLRRVFILIGSQFCKNNHVISDKPPKADYTFVEKLVTQIIKNIQLNIKNIHIRYEDKVTSPNPFSLGITLSDLHVVSTDEAWKPAITKENITKIFKVDLFFFF
jgi:hypothetical protein